MIFFETMPMEAKLIVLGIVSLLWVILYKILKPQKEDRNYKIKFIILHTLFGFVAGLILGLVLSTFSGQIDVQTNYSLKGGIILASIFLVYSFFIKNENIKKVLISDFDWAETGWVSLIIAAAVMYCFIQAFKIPSGSMRMTLVEGDHLFVNKLIYGIKIPFTDKRILQIKEVKHRDIVIFDCPDVALSYEERKKRIQKDFIKRCVGLPGDKIEIKNKVLYINDVPQQEPYVNFEDENIYQTQKIFNSQQEYQTAWQEGRFTEAPAIFIRDNFGPVIVPQGHYFVLGDNRDRSFDSRFWGPLKKEYIKGAPLIVYWPPKRIRIPK